MATLTSQIPRLSRTAPRRTHSGGNLRARSHRVFPGGGVRPPGWPQPKDFSSGPTNRSIAPTARSSKSQKTRTTYMLMVMNYFVIFFERQLYNYNIQTTYSWKYQGAFSLIFFRSSKPHISFNSKSSIIARSAIYVGGEILRDVRL